MNNELQQSSRIQSVDVLRGLVMVLMAIDHVRVYSGLPAGGPEAGIFLTRWVTHFCAPAFTFFAGTSIFLYGSKINDRKRLAKYLITRGLLLVLLEVTVIRFFWAFNVDFSEFILAGVIWMLGWCMVLMAALIWLRPLAITLIGLFIILFQQLFAKVPYLLPEPWQASLGRVWEFIYSSGFDTFGNVAVLYVIVPWIGVMAAGYGFGAIVTMDSNRLQRICLTLGLSMTAVFIVVGSYIVLAKAGNKEEMPFVFRLLNQSKYPPSVLFLLMTLGPVVALVPFAEKVRTRLTDALIVIGRVPFFYYLVHVLLIHVSGLIVHLIVNGAMHQEWFLYAPYVFFEEQYRWSLPLLYLVFAIDVTILYFMCRWYERYKSGHPEKKWLKYL